MAGARSDHDERDAGDDYAASLPSVIPSAFITWFQAHEACADAGEKEVIVTEDP